MAMNQSLKQQIEKQKMPNGKKKALLTAIDLFSSQGYSATSTSQIAKQAGISEATIFKYFKTKQQLLDSLLESIKNKLIPFYQKEFIDEFANKKFATVEEFAYALISNRYDFLQQNQQLFQILVEELLVNPDLRKDFFKISKGNLASLDAQFKQIIPDKSISAEEMIMQTIRLLFGYFMQQLVIRGNLPPHPKKDLQILSRQLTLALE